jgi:hypothetical protein
MVAELILGEADRNRAVHRHRRGQELLLAGHNSPEELARWPGQGVRGWPRGHALGIPTFLKPHAIGAKGYPFRGGDGH